MHDLRSALDQLGWQLAILAVGEAALTEPRVGNLITFPIASSEERFRMHKAIPYFGPDALAVIEGYQPYQNEGTRLVNPLALLQEWSNADKHRVLTASLGRVAVDELTFRSTATIDIKDVTLLVPDRSLVDPELPLLRIPAPESAHIAFLPPPVHVCFLTGVTGGPDVVNPETIPKLCEQVSECVNAFEPLFPPVDWSGRTESWITPDLPV